LIRLARHPTILNIVSNLSLLRGADPDTSGHVAVRLEEDGHVENVDMLAEKSRIVFWRVLMER
jgi:hypothetical protein